MIIIENGARMVERHHNFLECLEAECLVKLFDQTQLGLREDNNNNKLWVDTAVTQTTWRGRVVTHKKTSEWAKWSIYLVLTGTEPIVIYNDP